ncbi:MULTISPECIES: hypothetical protein [Acinetobacter]|uniref:hypothetical protein n=1 Tax=Acinetobacter TaxID=469 RepID=UPI001F4ABE5F|nr:hypothetical protein [Acinetobacter higginsii]MCH7339916.1 hypothetical protein [Acinetobacter higginsii]
MKRIDSVNARPNVNGAGKTGFHDNNDISGQDATYLTPDWLNHIQEELCAIIEKNGHTLNSGQRDQLFQLLATNQDILDLADAVQQKLDTEKAQRIAADNVLQTNINSEANIRSNADMALQNGINNEATARGNADTALHERLLVLEAIPLPLGYNQSWVSMSVVSDRVPNTPYKNLRNRAIAVNIAVKINDRSGPAKLVVNDEAIAQANCDVGPGGYIVTTLHGEIPAGAEYKVIGVDGLLIWSELK